MVGSQLCLVWHPLENEFKQFKDNFLSVLQREQLPSFEDLKNYCCEMTKSPHVPLGNVEELQTAQNYAAVVKILFAKVCKWLSFSLLKMIMDYFEENLSSPQRKLYQYEKALKKAEKALMKVRDGCHEKVARCKLSAKRFKLEDVRKYQALFAPLSRFPNSCVC